MKRSTSLIIQERLKQRRDKHKQEGLVGLISRAFTVLSKLLLFTVSITQLFDFIFTSISIQDFLGTGQTFVWSVREAHAYFVKKQSPAMTFTYDNEYYHHKDALTKYGYLMVKQMGEHVEDFMWGSVGFFDNSRAPEMDMCNYFKGYYLDVSPERARFLTTKEKLTLVRPLAPAQRETKTYVGYGQGKQEGYDQADLHTLDRLTEDGYLGTRRAVELRMTTRMDFNEGPGTYLKEVKAVRSYIKSFCDACQPIAEMGQMFCALETTVVKGRNDSVVNVNVTASARREHSYHRMGVAFPSSQAALVETFIRLAILAYVAHTMLNICTTAIKSDEERFFIYKQQGADAATLMSTKVTRPYFSEFFLPEQNITRASPFSLTFVMYNSDVIVFFNFIVVMLTFITSMQLKHEVVWWAHHHETLRAVITRVGVNAKMMWLYLALIKLMKHTMVKLRKHDWTVYMCFDSHVFVWFWVIYLVLLTASGYDFLLDPLFHDRVDIVNNFMLVNDISVQFQYGFYFVRLPSIAIHSILVSFVAIVILMVLQKTMGTTLPNNSLFRTFACCHSCLIYDPELFQPDPSGNAIILPLSTMMNLKWFLKCHSITSPSVDVYEAVKGNNVKVSIKQDGDKDESIPTFTYSILLGGDGGLHIKQRETRKDLEQTINYRQWLQNGLKLVII